MFRLSPKRPSTMPQKTPRPTGLVLDTRFTEHVTRAGHPERPERILEIDRALRAQGLVERCSPVALSVVPMEWLLLNHTREYLARLESACKEGMPVIDCEDSSICRSSFDVARDNVGAVLNAIDCVMKGDLANAFCAGRPPGHHAEEDRSMGFCLLNNVAIAARYLINHYSFDRVLILDWDVHHGNGTQHSFEMDPRVLFCSIHGHPDTLYPGTGNAHEEGKGEGRGFTLNIPMAPGSGDKEYRAVFERQFLPRAEAFKPQFVLISAGFDAHREDPVGNQALETESYSWMTREMMALADRHCNGRLVSLLEGGYNLARLGECVAVHVAELAAK